jgi:transposase-like protein
MSTIGASFQPPHCPNPLCSFHLDPRGWRFRRKGSFLRATPPHRVPRWRCLHCQRSFSSQTFSATYWLRRPDLPARLFLRLLSCSAYRQIARDLDISPSTVMRQADRLGRHCLLFHERLRPKGPLEALALDGFESFEFSQYTPVHFHMAIGTSAHFIYGFTDSELRRKGRMTEAQKRRRAELEAEIGRPDPRSIEREVAALLEILAREGSRVMLHTDDHPAYPRALRDVRSALGCEIAHAVTSSRAARTPQNPLFPVNLCDLLIRHSQANHKRETIAFSKRRACAAYRLWVFVIWRNTMKSFSERRRDASPAQRLGLLPRRLRVADVLEARLFPTRVLLPERWARYYRREVPTRRIPTGVVHRAKYAV